MDRCQRHAPKQPTTSAVKFISRVPTSCQTKLSDYPQISESIIPKYACQSKYTIVQRRLISKDLNKDNCHFHVVKLAFIIPKMPFLTDFEVHHEIAPLLAIFLTGIVCVPFERARYSLADAVFHRWLSIQHA
jgi:hypothetical protein